MSHRPTPGYSNDDAGYEAWLRSGGYENDEIYITEVMAQNRGTLADSDGDLSDWIEIANLGETSVDLAGWYLSDDPDVPDEWKIPSLTLAPGEYAVIFASGKNRTRGRAAYELLAHRRRHGHSLRRKRRGDPQREDRGRAGGLFARDAAGRQLCRDRLPDAGV